ncbi:MAG: hypothetical protein ACYSVY_06020, partial [Planctomycetota bacterium]
MSEFPSSTGPHEHRASERRRSSSEKPTPAGRSQGRGNVMSDDVNREVEAAMAAMSDAELAELTGKV